MMSSTRAHSHKITIFLLVFAAALAGMRAFAQAPLATNGTDASTTPALTAMAPPIAPPSLPSEESLRERLAGAAADTTLDQAQRDAISANLNRALAALTAISEANQRAAEFDKARAEAPATLEQLRSELAQPPPTTEGLAAPASLAEAEQQLALAEAEQSSADRRLAELNAEPARRAARRAEIPAQLAEARQELSDLKAEPVRANDGVPAAVLDAARTANAAKAAELEARIAAGEAEMQSYDARAALLTARRDLAVRRAAQSAEAVRRLRGAVETMRGAEANRQAQQARLQAARAMPAVAALAEENAALAAERTGEEGTAGRISAANRREESVRKSTTSLNGRFDATRSRVEAVGLNSAIGVLLQSELSNLPTTSESRRGIAARETTIPEVQLRLLELQEARRALSDDVDGAVADAVGAAGGSMDEVERALLETEVRKLLTSRLELYGALIEEYDQLLRKLVDLDNLERGFVTTVSSYEGFIRERILGIRGNSSFSLKVLKRSLDGARWYVSPTRWHDLGTAVVKDLLRVPLFYGFALALLVPMLVWRSKLRRLVSDTAEREGRALAQNFRPTLEVAGFTLLLAVPGPLVAAFLGWRLGQLPGAPELGTALSLGFKGTVLIYFILEVARQTLRPQGLGELHFDWNERSVQLIRFHLGWFTPLFVALAVFGYGLEVQGHADVAVALGSTAMTAFCAVLAVMLYKLLDPDGPVLRQPLSGRGDRLEKWMRWFWHPVLSAIPALLIAGAAFGYLYAAMTLAERYVLTLVFLFGILIVMAFLRRWLVLLRRRLAMEQARKRLEAAKAAREAQKSGVNISSDSVQREPEVDIKSIVAQTDRLLHWSVLFVIALGLWGIWANVLPAFGLLRQVVLWENLGAVVQAVASADGTVQEAVRTSTPVTLADLVMAAIFLIATFIAAHNIPGLLEIAVLSRLPLDSSVRFAMVTLTRYMIVMVGLVMGFGAIGIGWSKVQWLAAAFSVGLGFGLQEIFANFVSGIILLFERPMRLGDVVTIGDATGTVTRMQMRATVITDFERKELIVPNKEFVTGRLTNWTLTDKISRVLIPVGVAYGSDVPLALQILEQVAKDNPLILDDPKPFVAFWDFGASSIDLRLFSYVPNRDNFIQVITELRLEINRRFREAGIEIAFPQQDIHIRSVEGELPLLARIRADAPPTIDPEST